jgi:hypothetical protein
MHNNQSSKQFTTQTIANSSMSEGNCPISFGIVPDSRLLLRSLFSQQRIRITLVTQINLLTTESHCHSNHKIKLPSNEPHAFVTLTVFTEHDADNEKQPAAASTERHNSTALTKSSERIVQCLKIHHVHCFYNPPAWRCVDRCNNNAQTYQEQEEKTRNA